MKNMDEDLTVYFTVADERSQSKFICCTHRKHGLFSICLTDAATVWRTEYTEEDLNKFREKFNLKSTKDYSQKLRSASISGKMSVLVQDTGAELQLGSRPGDLSVSLSRLEGPQAAEELKDLLFRMADSLTQLDNNSKPSATSPVKYVRSPLKKRHTEFEPRQQQHNSMAVKRRPPGSSLINPGTKKKVQATGVAFDDADED